MGKSFALVAALILAGCTYPSSRIEQGAQNGFLTFPGATSDARVVLDGQDVGLASAYSVDHALSVKPGTHRVVVLNSNGTLIDRKYYVDAGANVVVRND